MSHSNRFFLRRKPLLGLPGVRDSGKLLPDRSKEVQGNPLSGRLFLSVHLSVYFNNTGNDPLKTPHSWRTPWPATRLETSRACLQSPFQDRKAACFPFKPGTSFVSFRAQTRNPEAKDHWIPVPRSSRGQASGNDNSRFCAFCPNVNTP